MSQAGTMSHSNGIGLSGLDRMHSPSSTSSFLSSGKKSPDKTSLKAAADLIQTLDTAFAEMNTLAASSARDAEEARRNARAASEVARRFSSRTFPKDVNSFDILTNLREPMSFGTTLSTPTFTPTSTSASFSASLVDPQAASAPAPAPASTSFSFSNTTERERPVVNGAAYPDISSGGSDVGRKRKTKVKSPSSSVERLAQSHAEDVLSLSLELERANQALKSEQVAHEETKNSLAEERLKNAQLEEQIQKLLNDMETQRESNGRTVDSLEKELEQSKQRVSAAEEDAQLALELAKGNAESREQLETWLQRALMEVQVLREQIVPSVTAMKRTGGKLSVRFADPLSMSSESLDIDLQPENVLPAAPNEVASVQNEMQLVKQDKETQLVAAQTTPSQSRPSRSLVAAGRNLLQRSLASGDNSSSHCVEYTPERSAERRRKFREHLSKANAELVALPPSSSNKSPQRKEITFTTSAMDACRSTVQLLQESAKRLGFEGHYWRDQPADKSEDLNLEGLTRQYCRSVEVKIERQKSEVNELQSLCEFLEQKSLTEITHMPDSQQEADAVETPARQN